MASSIGFRILSFLPSCYSSYGAWTLTPVGLAPTDHASLRWTHTFQYLPFITGESAAFRELSNTYHCARSVVAERLFFATFYLQLIWISPVSIIRCVAPAWGRWLLPKARESLPPIAPPIQEADSYPPTATDSTA